MLKDVEELRRGPAADVVCMQVPRTADEKPVQRIPGDQAAVQQRCKAGPRARRTELRDASSGFVAYVPIGSIARGETLVRSGGNGRTIACGTCHGADLKGLGPVPPLAGRSPSYTVRQLFDMQQGTRKGPWSALMKAAVDKLTIDDMIAIAAFTASREP